MTLKNRLAQLEKNAHVQPAQRIGVIEYIKTYEDGHTEVETVTIDEMYERLADRAQEIRMAQHDKP